MKCTVLVMLALATLVAVGAAQVTFLDTPVADKNQDQGRNVTGQVMTKAETPLPDAVVYLKNTKTLTIKSFITEKDGGPLSRTFAQYRLRDLRGLPGPEKRHQDNQLVR